MPGQIVYIGDNRQMDRDTLWSCRMNLCRWICRWLNDKRFRDGSEGTRIGLSCLVFAEEFKEQLE